MSDQTTHIVKSSAETIRPGRLDLGAPPVATIASGDIVRHPNIWTHLGNEAVDRMTCDERESLFHVLPRTRTR